MQLPSNPQRKKRQRSPRFSHLDEERRQLLDDIGFVWSSIDYKWLLMLEWAKTYGVVNYQLKLVAGGDGSLDAAYDVHSDRSATLVECEQHISPNNTVLLDNYHSFVHNIQNQTFLPNFHPQDRILALLSEEGYAHKILGQHQPSAQNKISSLQPNNDSQHPFQPTHIDYGISTNDTFHQPLKIWMTNQRSHYNRHQQSNNRTQDESSTMTAQRQKALEEINFPWSGRFRNRIEEVQYETEQLAEKERQREKERRLERKEREERERVEQLMSSAPKETQVDVMALWEAGDDDDDDW